MKLPSKLLGRVRAGVGIGAVVLGGCDPAPSAEDWASDEAPVVAAAEVAQSVEPVEVEAAEPELKPMLLSRDGANEGVAEIQPIEPIGASPALGGGVASVVEETIAASSSESEIPPIRDLGRPVESESNAFVPYDGGEETIATTKTPRVRPKIRPRPRPRPRAQEIDEPCDPGLVATTPPGGEWECPACGRG